MRSISLEFRILLWGTSNQKPAIGKVIKGMDKVLMLYLSLSVLLTVHNMKLPYINLFVYLGRIYGVGFYKGE
jgi:hypothetical protein